MMRGRKRFGRVIAVTGIVILLPVIIFWTIVDMRIRPMLSSYGNNQAVTAATRAMNDAVGTVIDESGVVYEEMSEIQRDSEGHILSLSMNGDVMNRLKAAVGNAVLAELETQQYQRVSIPVGSLFGGLMTGRGPAIRINVPMNSSVETSFSNTFAGAGVNQTIHRVNVVVKVQIYAVIQGEEMAVTVESQFVLAECLLVGEVPSWIAKTGT